MGRRGCRTAAFYQFGPYVTGRLFGNSSNKDPPKVSDLSAEHPGLEALAALFELEGLKLEGSDSSRIRVTS